ncbi:MAG TPA: hypothetical protein VNF68_05685 [Candidatus Baltobacteraceae bacterium]|nr:hypothetical protein [Candidatus Baltobacteraceae bacterium]
MATRLLRARRLLDSGDLEAAERLYVEALAIEPELAAALRARAEIALARDDISNALSFVRASVGAALNDVPSLVPLPLKVLQFGSVHPGAHTNTDRVLNPLWTETTTLLVEKWDLAWPLPAHDVIVNAISDAHICGPALELAAYLVTTTDRLVLNAPSRVLATTRTEIAKRLAHVEGLRVPAVERVTREEASRRDDYPFLLRVPGFHNGANFEMVRSEAERDAALAELPTGDLLAIEYVDTRASDGAFRKYRAMVVDGVLYPAHLAIGEAWNLHYFSANMTEDRRAEELSYLADMKAHLGGRAYQALERLSWILGLEYFGIDFGIDANGEIVLFEANASMTVHLPNDVPENAYRRAAVFNIDGAVYDLVARLATRPS